MTMALTRPVSRSLTDCALSFIERQPIDIALARTQHDAYLTVLLSLGLEVVELPLQDNLPDAVFVEDTAVVVDEVAILTAPPLAARRAEVASMATALQWYRDCQQITGEATLEGGDVLRIGRQLFVGRSARSNQAGIEQLAAFLAPYDYSVTGVEFSGCLHLKSAVSYLGGDTLLVNAAWVDAAQLPCRSIVEVGPGEDHAANALAIGETVILPANFPQTKEALEVAGFRVYGIDLSELQKAEAGVTCCSVIFE